MHQSLLLKQQLSGTSHHLHRQEHNLQNLNCLHIEEALPLLKKMAYKTLRLQRNNLPMNQKKMTIQQNQRRNVRDLRRQRIKLGGAQTHHRMLLEMVQGGLLAHIIEELLHHLIIIDIRLQEGAHQYLGMITQTMVSQIISTDRKDLHLLPQRNSMIVDQANMVTPPERAMVTLEKETMDQGIGIPQMPHITEMNIEREVEAMLIVAVAVGIITISRIIGDITTTKNIPLTIIQGVTIIQEAHVAIKKLREDLEVEIGVQCIMLAHQNRQEKKMKLKHRVGTGIFLRKTTEKIDLIAAKEHPA